MTYYVYDGREKRVYLDLYPCFEGPRIALISEQWKNDAWSEVIRIWVDADIADELVAELGSLADSARATRHGVFEGADEARDAWADMAAMDR